LYCLLGSSSSSSPVSLHVAKYSLSFLFCSFFKLLNKLW